MRLQSTQKFAELWIKPRRTTFQSGGAILLGSEWGTYEADCDCDTLWPGCRFNMRNRIILWRHAEVLGHHFSLGFTEQGGDGLCDWRLRAEAALGLERHRHGAGFRIDLLLFSFHEYGNGIDSAGQFLSQRSLWVDDRVLHDRSLQAAGAGVCACNFIGVPPKPAPFEFFVKVLLYL